MIWLALIGSAALAQAGPDPLGIYEAGSTAAAEAPPPGELAPAIEAAAVVAPRAAPAATTPTVSVPIPVNTGWLWSYGGPLLLLGGLVGGAWVIRKKGIKIPGLSSKAMGVLGGLQVEGPQVLVKAQTALAGQNSLAVIEVTGFGAPRSLLVTAGPGGSRLVADLTGSAPAAIPQGADAVAEAIRQALGAAAQAPPAVAPTPAAPVAVYAAPAPQMAQAAAAMPTSTPIPTAVQVEIAAPQGDQPASIPGELAFQARLAGAMDRAEVSPVPPPLPPRTPTTGASDWRSAAYRQRAVEPPPAEEDLVDVIGELAHRHRQRTPDATPEPRRASIGGRARRSHLEQLAQPNTPASGRRFPGPQRRSSVIRDAGSRAERTQAARELLEQVVARRRADRP